MNKRLGLEVNKKRRLSKKQIIILFTSIGLSCLILILAILSAFAYGGLENEIKMASAFSEIINRGMVPKIDELGYYTFTMPEGDDEPFKILQLTDLHIGGTLSSAEKDYKVFSAVYKMVESVKPDLIIFTGDVARPIRSPLCNLLIGMKTIGTLMENIGIPWTITYGNHDCEGMDPKEKSAVSAYLESLEHCIFRKGPTFEKINKSWAPEGNTFINILNSDSSHNTSLVLLDSNMYAKVGSSTVYDNIHDDQVEWYEKEIIKLADKYTDSDIEELQTLAFYHIPNMEFVDAYELYLEGSNEVEYLGGEINEEICNAYYKGKIFDKMVELNSTKGIFVGHDHVNNMSLKYRGIVLSYGLSIDYSAYDKIEFSTYQRGGTKITLEENEAEGLGFLIDKIKLVDIE